MLNELSTDLAALSASASPSILQVHGGRRPATGVAYAEGLVLTTTRALGREEGLRVRAQHADATDAELVGWDPATGLALLRVDGLRAPALVPAATQAAVGHLVLALARSWSNALTASLGVVSVIGGPLRTGRRQAIEEVIRTSAPMHEGFAGGALIAAGGGAVGITTGYAIRGFGVAIPASIAWKTAAALQQHGRVTRGYLGIAGQRVTLAARQRDVAGRDAALLVLGVTADAPAAQAGVLVGDAILALDDRPVAEADDLIDLLTGARIGAEATLRLLRADVVREVAVRIAERPAE